jgi:hypothetical protein
MKELSVDLLSLIEYALSEAEDYEDKDTADELVRIYEEMLSYAEDADRLIRR